MKLLKFRSPDIGFVGYIMQQYCTKLIFNYNPLRCVKLNEFLDAFDLTVEKIIKCVVEEITYVSYNDLFYLIIPEEKEINGMNLVSICRLIEYGTIDIAGYPIFDKTSNYIQKNLQSYLYQYDLQRG